MAIPYLVRYISTLTSKSVFYLFFFAYIFGSIWLFFNYSPVIITTLIVFCFSLVLIEAQNTYFISLSVTSKNSTYFLGYLFTLTSLFNVFLNMTITPGMDLAAKFSQFLIPQIGAALTTSIVGLVMRQFLISTDPTQEQHDKIFRIAMEELKENASTYRLAQQKLMEMLDNFVGTHTDLLKHEQDAMREHIEILSESSKAIGKLGQQYPQKIMNIITRFEALENRLDDFNNETVPKMHEAFVRKSFEYLESLQNDFAKRGEVLFGRMRASIVNLHNKVVKFANSSEVVFGTFPPLQERLFKESVDKLHGFQNSYIASLSDSFARINGEVKSLSEKIAETSSHFETCTTLIEGGLKRNLEGVETNLSGLSSTIAKASATLDASDNTTLQALKLLREYCDTLSDQMVENNNDVVERIRLLKTEITQVDELVDAFISAMRKRLQVS